MFRLIFSANKQLEEAGINKAYLDFCRTLKITDKDTYQEKIKECKDDLKSHLDKLIKVDIRDQDDFDVRHKVICESLIKNWTDLTYGQAQKWVNMSLKYWLTIGDSKIPSISKNAKYFHIPIDRFVMEGMFGQTINKSKAWSKLNYDEYMCYQLNYRKKSDSPLLDEFIFFNGA